MKSTNFNITIAVIEVAGGQSMVACLEAVVALAVNCMVVLREPDPKLQQQFRNFSFHTLDLPVPLRRKRAVELCDSEVVVLLEDTTIPDSGFVGGVAQAFSRQDCVAASGAVSVGVGLGERYQALACTEYGRYHSSTLFDDGLAETITVDRLPGNSLCYRRDTIMPLLLNNDEGLIEGTINQHLMAEGGVLLILRRLSVTYSGKDSWGGRLQTRFHHGWIYSGEQAERKGLIGRAVQSVKSLLLPIVLSGRAIKYMAGMREINRPFTVACWICAMELCWSLGEFVGSVIGKPKNMEQWR